MKTSEQVNEIFAALAKAQGKIKNPQKDKINPHFKSKYADLATGLEVIRPALSECGLSFVQATKTTDDGVILITVLGHSSGQWIECDYPVSKFAPHQQLGAALTYAKRQSLFALVGVCGDDDLDGEDAKDAPTDVKAKPEPKAPVITKDQQSYLELAKHVLAAFEPEHVADLRNWWAEEESNRESLNIEKNSPLWNELRTMWERRGRELAKLTKEAA